MSHKRPVDAVVPEQELEAARSPRKRLRRTILLVMWLERRRVKALTVEPMAQPVRQMQVQMAKLFMLLMVLVARLDALQRLFTEQFEAFQRSFMGSIEDKIRSAVQTEMQGRQAASLPNGVYEPPRQTMKGFPETGGITRMVKLYFVDVERPKNPLYTGCPVQWQNGANAKVAIFENERQITQGDLSKLQIEILPVHADFFTERGQADFSKEEFNKQIYTYKGKESVLTTVNLTNGEAYLDSFFFTESSYRKKLRLAARVKRQDLTVRVQEAITDPFVVKDRRSELNEKSYPPSKEEGVHRLEKISLKGKRCNYLAGKNITTVKHLMRHYHRDKSDLQKLTRMKKEDWSTMINHATTSDPGDEIYSYRVAEDSELLFNDFYDVVGMMINGSYVPYSVNDLDQFWQKFLSPDLTMRGSFQYWVEANNWKMSAYKKFEELENSGCLIPDYVMSNGFPVRVPSNNASPSIQARMQEFGERHLSLQQNGFSPAQVLSNNSKQETQYTYEQTLHQDGVSQQTSPLYHTQTDIYSGLSPIEELLELEAHVVDQGFEPYNAELSNFDSQFHGYEHDDGNR